MNCSARFPVRAHAFVASPVGFAALVVGQSVLGETGSYLLFTFIMIATVTTISGEVSATSRDPGSGGRAHTL